MALADVHAHLTHPKLIDRVDDLIRNARQAGVTTIVSNGLNPTDNARVLELAQRYEEVVPALGLYPVDAVLRKMRAINADYPSRQADCDPDEAVAWVRERIDQAFAVGEIGLDGYWVPEELWEEQERVFRAMVEIAIEHDKAIIIHTRKRERRCLDILKEMQPPRVDWHCFGSKVKIAKQAVELPGHYFSIPANAQRAENFTRMLEKLPRERLLLETDCPYLGPERDRDNEPANVARTAEYAAQCWGLSPDEAKSQFQRNFETLFAPEMAARAQR